MSGVGKIIVFAPELLVIISNNLDDVDQLSLALSGAFQGFDSVYNMDRNERAMVVNYRSHYLSRPSSWYRFFQQHPLAPTALTSFNVMDSYWLPAERLCAAIAKMENLEDLTICGTKLSLPHLAPIFQACKKITGLDFGYSQMTWEELQSITKKEDLDLIIQAFKKINKLKMFTSFNGARDYIHDPWLLIIRILSWCQDCTDLTIKVAGDYINRRNTFNRNLSPAEKEVKKMAKKVLFPQLEWMTTNLKNLVLISLCPHHYNYQSRLLFNYVFEFFILPKKRPRSHPTLERLWVENFTIDTRHLFDWWYFATPMKSFFVEGSETYLANDVNNFKAQVITQDEYFDHLEHMGPLVFLGSEECERPPEGYLPNLRSAQISYAGDDEMMDHFIQTHPNLEHLQLDLDDAHIDTYHEAAYAFKVDFQLLKLKSLICGIGDFVFTTETIESLVQVCPNISVLTLNLYRKNPGQNIEHDRNVLSAIRFRNLTTLHLHGSSFQFHDGSFLLPMIQQCPELENLHMDGTFDPASFLPNFDQFAAKAVNLRELRLGLNFKGIGSSLMALLCSLSKSLVLERLFLFDNDPIPHQQHELIWDHPSGTADVVVQFAAKMKRLVAFCIELFQFNPILVKRINGRLAKVVPVRPALWFHVDRNRPNFIDVPPVHYFQLIEPNYSLPLPIF